MAVDKEWTDTSIEEIAEGMTIVLVAECPDLADLPENSPRYVLISKELVRLLSALMAQSSNRRRNTRTVGYHNR